MMRRKVRFITERGSRLFVLGGALGIKHGDAIECFDPGRHHLHTMIVDAALGVSFTASAIEWLSAEKVELLITGMTCGDVTIFTPQPLSDSSRTALRYRRAQWRALFDPRRRVDIARRIVLRKLAEEDAPSDLIDIVHHVRSVAKIRHCEAQSAALWWRSWRGHEMMFSTDDVPASWRRFEGRYMGRLQGRIGELPRQWTPRGATTPMVACHNYAIGTTAARVARALTALGADVTMGFLHDGLTPGRPSLAWDLVEIWRPRLARAVFGHIDACSFMREDFRIVNRKVRLSPRVAGDIARMSIDTVPAGSLIKEARWLIRLWSAHVASRSPRSSSPIPTPAVSAEP